MSNQVLLIFLIALALFGMQAVGGWFQIRDYKIAVRRVHKLGNVGVGQTKGRFLSGNLVLIACDGGGTITGCEVMDGLSFLAKFHPCDAFQGRRLVGENIDTFLALFETFDKKQRRRNKGYIQAVEALALRLRSPAPLDESTAGEQPAPAR